MGAPKKNKNAVGNNGGRPPLFNSPEEMQAKVDEYFNGGCEKVTKYTAMGVPYEIEVPTVCGLALFLGFAAKQSLFDYQEKVEFTDVVKKARTRIEMMYEQKLHEPSCTGSIFALKNMGWVDAQKITHDIPQDSELLIKARRRAEEIAGEGKE